MAKLDPYEMRSKAKQAWIVTFADLMALLMGFFIMLFSQSEVNKDKYKQLSLSMKQAFGSQSYTTGKLPGKDNTIVGTSAIADKEKYDQFVKKQQAIAVTTGHTKEIRKLLDTQIHKNKVEVKQFEQIIIIRLLDGAFPSGSSDLSDELKNSLAEIGKTLSKMPGTIVVSGYTDNVPIKTALYRSNWELSAARAYSVIMELVELGGLSADRIELRGFGETHSLGPNDTPENRAKNRRVEIMLDQRAPVAEPTEQIEKSQ